VKYGLPENHGLSTSTVQNLVFEQDGQPALSDVQHAAVEAGIGRGESLLVVSPTSTGKTQIGLWAIARSLEAGTKTVYLVTHRALAKQKFEDFKNQLLDKFMHGEKSSLVIATGDYVEDAEEQTPASPLDAPLLVATYEKYLALLSATGVPKNMANTVIVCDEIQLIGDKNRGQNVEILLTFLRNAGWKQFVGLSAVLTNKDAEDLANWLCVKPLIAHQREKHLLYECWTSDQKITVSTDTPEQINSGVALPDGVKPDPVDVLFDLLAQPNPPLPIIVFCMRKQDTYDLAEKYLARMLSGKQAQLSLAFDELPETNAKTFLSKTLEHRIASHNADLTDEERKIVEQHLLDGKLDVVFATTTLAAGVNFPLGAAVFAQWHRWDSDQRTHVAIDTADFHNMAGRVGRMGFAHEQGKVIFFAERNQLATANQILNIGVLPPIEPRISTERFSQLALQLLASGLCSNREELTALICTTFSALREEDRNNRAFKQWPERIHNSIEQLKSQGLALETSAGKLVITPVGKALGHSGLLVETGLFLLDYLVREIEKIDELLPTNETSENTHQLEMMIFSACFNSPEFRRQRNTNPTRILPYQLDDLTLYNPSGFQQHLAEPTWQADKNPINSALISCLWIDGKEIKSLEGLAKNLGAGTLRELFRNLAWVLQGLSKIVYAAADKRVPVESRPPSVRRDDAVLHMLTKLPRTINVFSQQLFQGLPTDVTWMTELSKPGEPFSLARHEILQLRELGYGTPEKLMMSSDEASAARCKVFDKTKPSPHAKANWVRDSCRSWKVEQRKMAEKRHLKRAKNCPQSNLVTEFYESKGTEFEKKFEEVLDAQKISYKRLDDKTKTGAPDYLIDLKGSTPFVLEVKTKVGDKLVDYNSSVEVLAASEIHGYRDSFCITLCHPGVDPSVPTVITKCGRLSVVESTDLGEAFIRLCEGKITEEEIWQWLTTPGQALASDLPFTSV
jgi:helicase